MNWEKCIILNAGKPVIPWQKLVGASLLFTTCQKIDNTTQARPKSHIIYKAHKNLSDLLA